MMMLFLFLWGLGLVEPLNYCIFIVNLILSHTAHTSHLHFRSFSSKTEHKEQTKQKQKSTLVETSYEITSAQQIVKI